LPTRNSSTIIRFTQTQVANKISTQSYADRVFNSDRTGASLPNWKRIIASGGNATSGLSGTKREGNSSGGTAVITYAGAPTTIFPDGIGSMSLSGKIVIPTIFETGSLGVAEAENQALQRVIADAISIQQQMSGPTFLGELRESLQMVKRPAQGLLRGLNRYALAQRDIIARHPKWQRYERRSSLGDALSNSWLEYSYGWKPLINDMHDAIEAVKRFFRADRPRKTARGYGVYESLLASSTSKESYGLQFFAVTHVRRKHKTKVIYKVWIKPPFGKYPGSLDSLQDLLGFRMSEFIPTVWELIPYSFVVDYFSNVGSILTNVSFDQTKIQFIKKDVIFDTEETRVSMIDEASVMNSLGPNFRGAIGAYGRSFARTKQVSRSAPSSLPIPVLELRVPDADSLQWLNLAALFRNLAVR